MVGDARYSDGGGRCESMEIMMMGAVVMVTRAIRVMEMVTMMRRVSVMVMVMGYG